MLCGLTLKSIPEGVRFSPEQVELQVEGRKSIMALGDLVDHSKNLAEVPMEQRRAVIRCPKRHQMGIVTTDELLLGREPIALSSPRDIHAWCPHPGCPQPGQQYVIHMDRLRRLARRWRARRLDILISEIATQGS